jgi:hypothetical protein
MIKRCRSVAPLLGVVVGVVVAADSIPRPWDDAKSNPCSLNLSDAKSNSVYSDMNFKLNRV